MYSDGDIDAAVAANALTAEAAASFRAHFASVQSTPVVDEENFRLLSGFNDIFVTIAGILLLVGGSWIGGAAHPAIGSVLVAGFAWGLSEYFTKVRRMALPSIVFLLAFIGGVFGFLSSLLLDDSGNFPAQSTTNSMALAGCAATTAAAAWLHWRRFQVPITIAAGVAAVIGVVIGLVFAAVPTIGSLIYPILLVVGLCVFVFAMRWDMADRERKTRQSDVAFWLHLLAAPMIAHPVFQMLGLLDGGASIFEALTVILIYIAMGVIALTIDRRALLVSALA